MFLARMSFFLSSFFMFFIDDKNYSYGRCIFLILPKMVFPIFVKPKTDHPVDPREARHGLGGAGRRHRPAGNLRPAADSHPSCRKNTLQRTKLLQTPTFPRGIWSRYHRTTRILRQLGWQQEQEKKPNRLEAPPNGRQPFMYKRRLYINNRIIPLFFVQTSLESRE